MHARYHPHLVARNVAKFNKDTRLGSKVLSANTLHVKPIFHQPLKKVVKGPPSPMRGALVRFGHSLARVKIWGRSTPWGSKYDLSKKIDVGG